MRLSGLALSLFIGASAFAQFTVTPTHGPVAGGTAVTIHGDFGFATYGVIFGGVTLAATKVDEHTLVATTPAHLPGTVRVSVFEYDIGIDTGQDFTFEGAAETAFEPLLLPVFTPPIAGAFGSEFHTQLTGRLSAEAGAEIYGLRSSVLPGTGTEFPLALTTLAPDLPEVHHDGTPGRFIYMPKDQVNRVVMNLRAYDASRSAKNFGTEIPIVRASEFVNDTITLVGIPSDPLFRNTLRIYGYGGMGSAYLAVTITDAHGVRQDGFAFDLSPGTLFQPGYADFTIPSTDVGMLRITIEPIGPTWELPRPTRWAFVSVTNNETQHITLITPQPRR